MNVTMKRYVMRRNANTPGICRYYYLTVYLANLLLAPSTPVPSKSAAKCLLVKDATDCDLGWQVHGTDSDNTSIKL